jgi:hypothetical protein
MPSTRRTAVLGYTNSGSALIVSNLSTNTQRQNPAYANLIAAKRYPMDRITVTFEQVAAALEAKAAARQTIAYNDFADLVGLPRPNNMFRNNAVSAYFEQIDV